MVPKVYSAAYQLRVETIFKACSNYLVEQLNAENCLSEFVERRDEDEDERLVCRYSSDGDGRRVEKQSDRTDSGRLLSCRSNARISRFTNGETGADRSVRSIDRADGKRSPI